MQRHTRACLHHTMALIALGTPAGLQLDTHALLMAFA